MSFTKESITEFISGYWEPLSAELDALREKCESDGVPVILRETEMFLSFLISVKSPRSILEIGTAYGYSALFFAAAAPDARITTIERSERMIVSASSNFEEMDGEGRIELLEGDAGDVLSGMLESNAEHPGRYSFDLVFIDAGKSHYREYFDKASAMCGPGSVVVCDNILMRGWTVDQTFNGAKRHSTSVKYMRSFIDYITGRDDLTVSLLTSGDGLALIRFNE